MKQYKLVNNLLGWLTLCHCCLHLLLNGGAYSKLLGLP